MGALQIIGLIFKFGPTAVSLAWKLYKLIEEYSHRKENDAAYDKYDGEKATSVDKRSRFDILFKAASKKDMSVEEVAEIREAVHNIKSRKKRGKAK